MALAVRDDKRERGAPVLVWDGHWHGIYSDPGSRRLFRRDCDPVELHTPIALCSATAMILTWRSMASSDSASTITRASFSVPE